MPLDNKDVPIVYAFVYKRLKERNQGKIVRTSFLKTIIYRNLCWNKASHNGLPRCLVYDIIKEMEAYELIKRITHREYKILKSNCDKKVTKLFW